MGKKPRLFLLAAVIAFVVAALRFAPGLVISSAMCDFAAGLGVAFLIGVLVTWKR